MPSIPTSAPPPPCYHSSSFSCCRLVKDSHVCVYKALTDLQKAKLCNYNLPFLNHKSYLKSRYSSLPLLHSDLLLTISYRTQCLLGVSMFPSVSWRFAGICCFIVCQLCPRASRPFFFFKGKMSKVLSAHLSLLADM